MKFRTSRQFLSRLASRRAARLLGAATLLTLGTISVAQADTYYWDPTQTGADPGSGGTGLWNTTSTFWHPAGGTGDVAWPNTTTNTADFAGTAGTVTLGSNITAGGLIFDTTAYTLATGTNTLSLDASGIMQNVAATTISGTGGLSLTAAQTWTVASGGVLTVSAAVANGGNTLTLAGAGNQTISGVISGSGGLVMNGTGTLTLTAANTFTGGITLYSGTLAIPNQGGSLGALPATASTQLTFAGNSTFQIGFNSLDPKRLITINPGVTGTIDTGTNTSSGVQGVISGAGSLAKIGTGTLTLVGANTYGGGTTISAGTLQLGSGGTTGSISGSGAVANNGNLAINRSNAATQGTDFGTISGTGAVTLLGSGTTTLNATNTYTGTTTVNAGTLSVSGVAGSIASSSSTTIAGGTVTLDNGSGNLDRLNNTGSVTLGSSGVLNLVPNTTTNTTETIGALGISNGTSTVTVSSASGRVTTLAASGFSRANNGTALFRGTSLSQSVATNVARITLGSANPSGLSLVGTNQLNSGATGDATQALKIVPYLIGDSSATGTGNNFVTYDQTLGLRVLTTAEDTALTSASTTAASPINAYLGTTASTSVTLASSADLTVNSLMFNTATQTLNGSGGALISNSGAVAALNTASTQTIGSGFSKLTLGNGEGVLSAVTGATLVVNTPVDVTSGGVLTKGGAGTVTLSAANLYTGATTINAGTLNLTGSLAANSGAVTINPTATLLLAQATGSTFTNNIVNNGTLSVTNAGAQTLSGNISGTGGLAQATTGTTLTLSGTNTYTGATAVSAGILALSGSVTGSNITISGTGTFSEASTGVIGGAGNTFTLTAGTATLAGQNTYTGSTTFTAGTLNIAGDGTSTSGPLGIGALVLSTGGTLQAVGGAHSIANNITNSGSAAIISGSNNLTFNGVYTTSTSNTVLTVNNSGLTTFAGGINIRPDTGAGRTTSFSGSGNILVSGVVTDGLPGATGGILGYTGTGTLILTAPNTYTGNTTIASGGTVQLGNGGTMGSLTTTGNVVDAGTFIINRSNAISQANSFGIITGAGAVTLNGTGTTTFTAANTYTGATTVNHGTLNLDSNATGAPASNIVSTSSALVMGGTSTLNVLAKSNTATSQTFSGTTLNSGAATIAVNPAAVSPNAVVLNLNTITRSTGGTVNFTLPTGTQNSTYGIRTTTANTATSILGGWATAGLNDWAVSGGNGTTAGNITALGTYFVSDDVANLSNNTANSTSNVTDSNGFNATYTNNLTINSLRFNSGSSDSNFGIVSGQGLTLNSGGILVTNNTGAKYQRIGFLNTNFNAGEGQGTITSGSADLVINQNNSGSGHLEIYSIINGGIGLTKSGAGYLELRGLDATYTGVTTVNAGTMKLTAATTATSGVVINNTGTLLLGGNNRINDTAPVTLNAGILNLGGFSEGAAGTNGVGALTLSYTSTLDFGPAGTNNLIQFAGLGTHTLGSLLQVTDWEGTAGGANGTDRLLFAGTSSAFTGLYAQSDVSFNGVLGYGVTDFGSFFEVYGLGIAPVPEPATWAAGILLVGVAGWQFRRRNIQRTA